MSRRADDKSQLTDEKQWLGFESEWPGLWQAAIVLPRFRMRGTSRVIAEDAAATKTNMSAIIIEGFPELNWLVGGQRVG